jgi:hypothetical protein
MTCPECGNALMGRVCGCGWKDKRRQARPVHERIIKIEPLPWQGVIDGTMSREVYWGDRKPPSECNRQEIIKLYGPSPCDRDRPMEMRGTVTFEDEAAF